MYDNESNLRGPARRRALIARDILTTAFELTAGNHVGWTMEELAERLGYSVGALYRYYPSRRALEEAMEADLFHRRWLAIDQGLRDVDTMIAADELGLDDVAEVLKILVVCRIYTDVPDHQGRSSGQEVPKGVIGRSPPGLEDLLELLADLQQEAITTGSLRPGSPWDRAKAIWLAIDGIVAARAGAVGTHADYGEDLFEEMVVSLLVGWGSDHDRMVFLDRRAQRIAQACRHR